MSSLTVSPSLRIATSPRLQFSDVRAAILDLLDIYRASLVFLGDTSIIRGYTHTHTHAQLHPDIHGGLFQHMPMTTYTLVSSRLMERRNQPSHPLTTCV
ncbi:unnamed protein product [Protopolystoma xenopodis]|uniref:Uncharacterized protein n=1 Tax=Protopolystoma xenopodis TaxID=117903 RepID=A0A3S5CTM9_9PLAT|nr:unnamed protein product [Protopolystoma xenopodis]